jgi:hypothetical protein
MDSFFMQKRVERDARSRLVELRDSLHRLLHGEDGTSYARNQDGVEEPRLTDRGRFALFEAETAARGSAAHLTEVIVSAVEMDTMMLDDCLSLFEVAAAALRGSRANDSADAVYEATSLCSLLGERIQKWSGSHWGEVAESVEATTDAAALVALLAQVGGRMPS